MYVIIGDTQYYILIENLITVLEDYGINVVIRYEDLRQEEYKQCYFSSKGRFIKIRGRRHYI